MGKKVNESEGIFDILFEDKCVYFMMISYVVVLTVVWLVIR